VTRLEGSKVRVEKKTPKKKNGGQRLAAQEG
jgi:hypothetical protein